MTTPSTFVFRAYEGLGRTLIFKNTELQTLGHAFSDKTQGFAIKLPPSMLWMDSYGYKKQKV